MIRGLNIRVVSVGDIMMHNSEVEVPRIGTFHVIHFSKRVSLIDPLRFHFRFLIEASLALVIVLVRVVISLCEVLLISNIVTAVILCQLDLLISS